MSRLRNAVVKWIKERITKTYHWREVKWKGGKRERDRHFVTSKRVITGSWFDATQKLGYPERDGKSTPTHWPEKRRWRCKEPKSMSHTVDHAHTVQRDVYRCRVHEKRVCPSPSNQRSRLVARASLLCCHHVNTQGRELTPNETKNDAFRRAQICTNKKTPKYILHWVRLISYAVLRTLCRKEINTYLLRKE